MVRTLFTAKDPDLIPGVGPVRSQKLCDKAKKKKKKKKRNLPQRSVLYFFLVLYLFY